MFLDDCNASCSDAHAEIALGQTISHDRKVVGSTCNDPEATFVDCPADGGPPVTLEDLTRREKEVVEQLLRGSSNKVIAYDLGIAHSTVRVLLHRAMTKFGVHERAALFALLHALPAKNLHQHFEDGCYAMTPSAEVEAESERHWPRDPA